MKRLNLCSLQNSFKGWNFTTAENRWLAAFVTLSVFIQGLQASIGTVLGPARPYLEHIFKADSTTFSFLWAVHGSAYLLGVILSTWTYKRYILPTKYKMVYYTICIWVANVAVIASLFTGHVGPFMALQFLTSLGAGAYGTVNMSQFVLTMGPIVSRPFTMLAHCTISAGFFLGTLIVRPFLPPDDATETDNSAQAVCVHTDSSNATGSTEYEVYYQGGIPAVFWPFIIIGVINIVIGSLYLILPCSGDNFSMPVFVEPQEHQDENNKNNKNAALKMSRGKIFIVLLFCFYFISCSIERIFQSTVFKFGLCGPLGLSPGNAAISDSSYNGGFMFGRILATLLAAILPPLTMALASLAMTLSASILLVFVEHTSAIGLYIGSGLVGMALSWQFGSVYSWTAMKLDITGRLASLFSGGCAMGGIVLVPLVNYIMAASGNDAAMIWTILTLVLVQILVFGGTWLSAKPKVITLATAV